MVLPVEYTKGLEFDGVLLYHPSAEHYPAEDRYVKLLYVAATRALHELTVVHQGDLTDLIARPVSGEKRIAVAGRGEKGAAGKSGQTAEKTGNSEAQSSARVGEEKRYGRFRTDVGERKRYR